MRKFYFICFGVFIALFATALWWSCSGVYVWSTPAECIEIYQKNARTPIFSGFLTMGSFLLALKATILGRIKETYDTKPYRTTYRAHKLKRGKLADRYYGSLERLSRAIGLNVILCLCTALLQMTLGFSATCLAFAICAGAAGGTLVLLIWLTVLLMRAHHEWFNAIEQLAQENLENPDK